MDKVGTDAQRLPPQAFAYMQWRVPFGDGILLIIAIAVIIWDPLSWITWILTWIVAPLAALSALSDLFWLNRLKMVHYRYRVTGREVWVRSGRLWRSEKAIATVQIVAVEVEDGPILRRFGLAELSVSTINGKTEISPILLADAHRYRDLILGAIDEAATVGSEHDLSH